MIPPRRCPTCGWEPPGTVASVTVALRQHARFEHAPDRTAAIATGVYRLTLGLIAVAYLAAFWGLVVAGEFAKAATLVLICVAVVLIAARRGGFDIPE